jgi:hypothetical protein
LLLNFKKMQGAESRELGMNEEERRHA